MRLFKELIPLFFIIVTAYGGGLFFGSHPEHLRNFWGKKKIIIGLTPGTKILNSTAFQWLQDRSPRNLELRILEGTSKLELFGVDLLVIPSLEVSTFSNQFKDPLNAQKLQIDTNLLREQDQALPFLWRIVRNPSQKSQLLRWLIADVSGGPGNTEIISIFLDQEFQGLLISMNPGFLPSLRISLTEKNLESLHQTPLQDLNY